MTTEVCYCGRLLPHTLGPECEKPRVRVSLTAEERAALDRALARSVEVVDEGFEVNGASK